MPTELTRSNRYEPGYVVVEAQLPDVPYSATIPVVRCRSCGSVVFTGSEDLHERLHPRVGCQRMGCGAVHGLALLPGEVFDPTPHAWEEMFPAPAAGD